MINSDRIDLSRCIEHALPTGCGHTCDFVTPLDTLPTLIVLHAAELLRGRTNAMRLNERDNLKLPKVIGLPEADTDMQYCYSGCIAPNDMKLSLLRCMMHDARLANGLCCIPFHLPSLSWSSSGAESTCGPPIRFRILLS